MDCLGVAIYLQYFQIQLGVHQTIMERLSPNLRWTLMLATLILFNNLTSIQFASDIVSGIGKLILSILFSVLIFRLYVIVSSKLSGVHKEYFMVAHWVLMMVCLVLIFLGTSSLCGARV